MDNGILIAGLLSLSTLISFGKAALGLGVVIFVHELGHFLVAKACGVKCEKFYVGFDPPIKIFGISLPRTLFKKKWGETEYGIGIVPLGGYVKMLGQDDNPANAAAEVARIKAEGGQIDPRSYPAKSVPQRMAIISAGVIFNLIFGVVFASVAYKMGVPYMPTVISQSGVGDPAWIHGMQPGDQIVSMHEANADDDQLRWMEDLKIRLFAHNPGDPINMRVKNIDGEVRSITITPNANYQKRTRTPTIGVRPALTPTVGYTILDSVAGKAGLKPGDEIQGITVDGNRIPIDPDGPGIDVQQVQASFPHRPMTLHVVREDEKTEAESKHDIELGVSPGKRFGIELAMGPIVCIQAGSIADTAGLKVGDKITQIDGQPVGDPMTLHLRLLDFADKSVALSVDRDGAEQIITLMPRAPRTMPDVRRRNAPMGLDALGIGYNIDPTVTGVTPDTPAARAGIQPGDVIQTAQLLLLEKPIPEKDKMPWVFGDWQKYRRKKQGDRMMEAFELDKPLVVDAEQNNWPFILSMVQDDERYELEVKFKRAEAVQSVTLAAAESTTMLDADRGFGLSLYEQTRVAESWSEAFSLGVREIWEGMKQVVIILRRISSNYKDLGGPITIAAAATMQASEGLPLLLIFLTLLSANLAVLNFLPIPVLDGGHMVFLAYEGIVGKPVNERVQMSLTLMGASMLLCLMLFVLGLDLFRFLG